jgi:hypothetical protein
VPSYGFAGTRAPALTHQITQLERTVHLTGMFDGQRRWRLSVPRMQQRWLVVDRRFGWHRRAQRASSSRGQA